ncbi:MAG: hypothetical protein Q7L55_06755 [Actinomycetota bacterium]|nr:hypothetical protein [Actinomycetota bacterium]
MSKPKRAIELVLFRVFSSSADAVLQRRPTDLLLLAAGVVGLGALAWYAPGPTSLDESISSVVSTAPGTFNWLWQLLYALMLLWVVYLAIRLAVLTPIVVTASPYMTRPLRRLGRVLIALGAIACVALGLAYPIGITAGLLMGMVAAAVVHLLRGSPAVCSPSMRLRSRSQTLVLRWASTALRWQRCRFPVSSC